MSMNQQSIEEIFESVWQWSEAQGFKGYNKHDGLNSPILRALLGWAKWPRIIAIQGVMRFPVNIRPLLLVPKTYNPKGLALFAMGCLDRYQATGNEIHLIRAKGLLKLLMELKSPGNWSGICWGYHYPWQDLGFYALSGTPNAVVTSFVCEAFLKAYCMTGEKMYLDVVESAVGFFLNDLTVLLDEKDRLCFGYMPLPMKMRVLDVSILIGAVLAQLVPLGGRTDLKETAYRLVNYVVGQQTEYGAWFYTDPPEDSPIRHDNYHTGFILDALWRYMEATEDWRWERNYREGLEFYAKELFNEDGSPRWMSDKDYPHDIHGAAQGIISFCKSFSYLKEPVFGELANKILSWTLTNLYSGKGYFYYQKYPFFTKKFTLMRWCNAWMLRGIASYARVFLGEDGIDHC